MKKKYLLTLLPLLALVGCNAQHAVTPKEDQSLFVRSVDEGVTAIASRENESTFKTYLMMGPFGYLSIDGAPVKGAVSDLHYENTIIWLRDAGDILPDASMVRSTVSGTTFRGWAYYDENNDHVWPDYYTTVPTIEGLALKAIFDGTDAGGNTGGGGSGGGSGGGTTQTGFGILKNGTEAMIGESKGTNFEGYDEYLIQRATFDVGDKFSLYDPSTLGTWVVDINPYSFSPDPSAATSDPARVASYISKGATEYTVNIAFTGDLYIQIMYQQDRLYIQFSA